MKKVLNQLFFLVCMCQTVLGQEQAIVPPSPETAALFRYQEYPMDYSTGLAQISIPLMVVKNGSLSVPISLSYHASGFRVTDTDGPVAAGWSLSVGGMVSRTIKGDPDFGDYPFPSPFYTDLTVPPGLDKLEVLEQVTHYAFNPTLVSTGQYKDSQYDVFSYTFGDQNGKFIFKDSANVKTPILLPHKPLKILPTTVSTGLSSILITNDNGDEYTFVGKEKTSSFDYTGFALDKILAANQKDSITYSYNGTPTPQYRRYISQYEKLEDDWYVSPSSTANGQLFEDDNGQLYYNINRIQEIDFVQGTVEFILKGGSSQDKDLIEYIQLKDRNGTLLKKIKFIQASLHSIALTGAINFSTHKLTGIEIQDGSGTVMEEYSFDYYPTDFSNSNGNGTIDPRFIDYWGYYNASGETNMIPQHTVNNYTLVQGGLPSSHSVGSSQADRDPDLVALKSGVLKKITYPTGGNAEFVYENNEYKSSVDALVKDGPGLRVKEIITNDANGNTYNRRFKYGIDVNIESGYGEIDMEPKLEYMYTQSQHIYRPDGSNDHRERIFYSGFLPSLGELSSRPVRYTQVTEFKGDASYNEGKSVYGYDNYKWTASPVPNHDGTNKWFIPNYNFWRTPELKTQTDYKAIKNGSGVVTSYSQRRKLSNVYTAIGLYDVNSLYVQRNYMFPQGLVSLTTPDMQTRYIEDAFFNYYNELVYAYGEYSVPVGSKNLTYSTEELTNDDGTKVMNKTTYVYNTDNMVSEVKTETSKYNGTTLANSIHKKNMTYPFDYTGNTVLDSMVARNMVRYKVEEIDSLDTQQLGKSYIVYKDLGNAIKPDTLMSSKGTGALLPKVKYHGYDDRGNPLEVSKIDGMHVSYIWGYDKQYPVAKVENATYTGVMATGISSAIYDNSATTDSAMRTELDKIRGHSSMQDAMVTSYTYNPLVGVTSITDPSGNTIYYEYDTFNRLKEVKDADGNLVSDYEYHYKGQ